MQLLMCGYALHRFPSDPLLKKKWENALWKEGFSASANSVLCSQHFQEECFDRTGQIVRVREKAVPSIFAFPAQHRVWFYLHSNMF